MKLAAAVVCGLLFAGQATPPRDRPVTGPANAVIRGRVVAAATGEPLHRVRVTLNTANPNPPTAVTDTRGQFEMTVPAGSYSMTATRAGSLPRGLSREPVDRATDQDHADDDPDDRSPEHGARGT